MPKIPYINKKFQRQSLELIEMVNAIVVDDPDTIYKPIEQRRAARPATHEQLSLFEEVID